MLRLRRNAAMLMSCVLACLVIFVGASFVRIDQAQAVEDMPTVSDADLNSGKINGTNWMSGLSGTLPLQWITIPGTHDSGMSNTASRTQIADYEVFERIGIEVGKRWAKTQDLEIDDQLNAGVRMLDIRITDTKPDASPVTQGDGGLWVCHGQNFAGRYLSFVYYPKVSSGKVQNAEKYLTFDRVMRYCADFLRAHPSETIILQVNREYKSGNDTVIWQRANDITKKWASAVNPSTGKSYVYHQANRGDDWHISEMPNLEDVRGQIVLATPNDQAYNYGMRLDTEGWGITYWLDHRGLAYENHYEVDAKTKADYVQSFYGGYPTANGEKLAYPQEGKISSKLPYNDLPNALFVNTSSNGFVNGNGSPTHIADYVNEILFTADDEDGPFFNDTRGKFYGWLNVDFVTSQIAKTIWISNYPKGGFEYTKLTFKPGEGVGQEKTYNVQRGSSIRLPQNMYSAPKGSGLAFEGWQVDDSSYIHQPGTAIGVNASTVSVTAKYTQTWSSIARLMYEAPEGQTTTVTLRNDITATNLDKALLVGAGKNIVINLNGHTINRNATTTTDVAEGSAIISKGNLTINGPGKITGGSAAYGGGINMRSGNIALNNVTIEKNSAAHGGGVYVASSSCSFAVSGNTRIAMNTPMFGKGANNVYLGNGAVVKGVGGLADGTLIGVTCGTEPTTGNPTLITDRLADDKTVAEKKLGLLSSDGDFGFELSGNNEGMLSRPYRVTFNTNGGGEVKTQLLKAGERAKEPFTPSKRGASFIGWYEPGSDTPYDFSTRVYKDVYLEASWSESTCLVTFDSAWGSPVQSQLIAYGKTAMKPDDPTREGYDFISWKVDLGNKYEIAYAEYNFDEPVTKSITLRAGWKKKTFNVIFKNEGSDYTRQVVEYDGKVARPANPPEREGYWFDGWRVTDAENSPLFNFDSQVRSEIVLYASWKKIPTYKVSFQPHGDNVRNLPADQWVVYGQTATAPESAPTREGYTFEGWYRSALYGGDTYNFNQPVYGEVNLYAQWKATAHTVTFDGNGEGDTVTNVPDAQTVKHDELAWRPQMAPMRDGYDFQGWTLDGAAYNFGQKVTGDITLKADWRIMTYSVFFRPNATGVTNLPEYGYLEADYRSTVAEPIPARAGYEFGGWYKDAACTDGNEFDFTTPITQSMELFAKWVIPSHKVTFDSDGGSEVAQQTVEHGKAVSKPADPKREGYVFGGWHLNGKSYDFDAVVTGDVTLKASWKKVETSSWVVVFDSDGGTEVEAASVADGAAVAKPADPTRNGYAFQGWYTYDGYDADEQYDFTTPVDNHLVLYAKWAPVKHAVTFDSDGGSAVASQNVDHDSQVVEPEPPTKDHFIFDGWYNGDDPYDFFEPVTGDLALKARWTAVPYTVTFDSAGGSSVATQSVKQGGKAARPDNPTRVGYAFMGWYAGDAEYDFSKPVTSDLTLTARWVQLEWLVVFSDTLGGYDYDAQVVTNGEKAAKPSPEPELQGYEFKGWFKDEALTQEYDFGAPVTGHLQLFAKWQRLSYDVTFDSAGGTEVAPQTVEYGATVTKPADPTRDHFTFAGWYEDGMEFDFTKPVEGNVELTAMWTPVTYAVDFEANGGTPVPDAQHVAYGGYVVEPDAPAKADCIFDGWYADVDVTDAITGAEAAEIRSDPNAYQWIWIVDKPDGGYTARVEFDFDGDAVDQPITLYARWNDAAHTVSFNANGGNNAPAAQNVEHGKTASAPDANPTRESMSFAGWYTDASGDEDALFRFDTPITSDLTLYAGWVQKSQAETDYTVSFDLNGGAASGDEASAFANQTVRYGGKASVPAATPTREHCYFTGWYTDPSGAADKAFNFTTRIKGDTVLYAGWKTEEHLVTFVAQDGIALDDEGNVLDYQVVEHEGKATRPSADPVREGYEFKGWYLSGNTDEQIAPFDFDNIPIMTDIVLYAKWDVKTYTVTFDSNGGSPTPGQQSVAYGYAAAKPLDDQNPAKENYDFGGWYIELPDDAIDDETMKMIADDPQLSHECWVTNGEHVRVPYDFEHPVTDNIILHARWVPESCVVTFDVDGGTPKPADQAVKYGSIAEEPSTDPAKAGFEFKGWWVAEEASVESAIANDIRYDDQYDNLYWVANDGSLRVPFDFESDRVYGDTTLYARWQPKMNTVTFVDDSGVTMYEQSVPSGEAPTEIDGGSGGFSAFIGWFADESRTTPYDFSQPITSDAIVYGKWETLTFTVTFDSNGGSAVTPQVQHVAYEEYAQKPADPVRDGHVFLGWFQDLSDELTPEDLASMKADLAEFIEVNDAELQDAGEIAEAMQALDEQVLVIDGKVLAEYDPDRDPVYSDMTVQAQWYEGSVETEIVLDEGAPEVHVLNFDEIANAHVTAKDIEQGVLLRLVVTRIDESDATDADRAALRSELDRLAAEDRMWLDISLYKVVNGVETKIDTTSVPLSFTLEVPDELRADTRSFYLLRSHNGEADVVSVGSGVAMQAESDRFSTYVLASKDATSMTPTKAAPAAANTAKTGDALSPHLMPLFALFGLLGAAIAIFAIARIRAR